MLDVLDYGTLVNDAWRLTWRFRSLWVLGLFAGGGGSGSCSFNSANPRTTTGTLTTSPQAEEFTRAFGAWVAANIGLVAVIGLIVLLVVLIGIVVSLIAQGGLTRAAAEAARGGSPTLGNAWSAGLRFFWRYVGLALIFIVFVICAAIIGAIIFAIVGLAGSPSGAVRPLAFLVVAVLGIGVGIVAIPTLSFAQRAIAVDDLGAVAALRAGWSLFWAHAGTAIVLLILTFVLAIVAAIVLVIGVLIAAIPFVIVAVILYVAAGTVGVPLALWGIIGVIALFVVALLAAAVIGTFLWHLWTLAYLRLSARAAPSAPSPA